MIDERPRVPTTMSGLTSTRYRAIVFKPFKGEVVDGVVNNVNKVLPFFRRGVVLMRHVGW